MSLPFTAKSDISNVLSLSHKKPVRYQHVRGPEYRLIRIISSQVLRTSDPG